MLQNSELREIQEYVIKGNLDLNKLPYWTLKNLLPICTNKKGFIPIGTFYVSYNTVNKYEFSLLKEMIKTIDDEKILFIPHLRKNDFTSIELLESCGFILIDVEGESIVHYSGLDRDSYLRDKISSKNFRDHKRLLKKSEEYQLKTYELKEVLRSDFLFDSWVRLFGEHEKKYGNTAVVYGVDFLNKLSVCELKNSFSFHFRFFGKAVIQVCLSRLTRDTLYLISAASNTVHIATGVNLYTTMMMDALQMKDRLRVEFLNLGRGGKDNKKKYGANFYIPHVHALYTKDCAAMDEILNFTCC